MRNDKLARPEEERGTRHGRRVMTDTEPRKIVLVVDDEPGVAKVVEYLLVQRGYRVLVAKNGEEALALARDHRGPIDLLLTDVMMPGMSGIALGAAMAQARPGLLIVYMSGYVTELLADDALRPGANFIAKPFNADALLAFVDRVLTARAEAE